MNKKQFLLLAWFIFSVFYFISALSKSYHIDEFFSWVYAEKCSFSEILTLKETGIGHPPAFHLLQKFVQQVTPINFPLSVRLVNYVFGSFFIIILINYFYNLKINRSVLIAIVISGSVLNTFVFARMWGMVTFFALLVLISGEEWIKNKNAHSLIILIISAVGGFLSDYNFFLVVPYIILVFLNSLDKKRVLLISGLLSLAFIGLGLVIIIKAGYLSPKSFVYSNLINMLKLGSEFIVLIFNIWYVEVFIISSFFILAVSLVMIFSLYEKNANPLPHIFLIIMSLLGLLYLPVKYEIFKLSFSLLIAFILLIGLFLLLLKRDKLKDIQYDRIVVSLAGAFIILLVMSQIFWKTLIFARYINVLLPLIVYLLLKNYSRNILNYLGLILLSSGIFYVTSAGIDIYYPAKKIESKQPIIFQNLYTYSSQYIEVDRIRGKTPYIMDKTLFKRNCKLCSMGVATIPFDSLISFIYIGDNDVPAEIKNRDFHIASVTNWSFNFGDELLNKVFTPYRKMYYTKFSFERSN